MHSGISPFHTPTAAKFVSVATFVEQHVSGFEVQFLNLVLSSFYLLDHREVEITTLHVCDSKVGHLS